MAKRCGSRNRPCNHPRANWWKQTIGVDWFNQGSSGGSSILVPPSSDFDYFEGVIYRNADGTYSTDYDTSVNDFTGTVSTTRYQSDLTATPPGNDTNDGLSPAAPDRNVSPVVIALNSAVPASGAAFVTNGVAFDAGSGPNAQNWNFDFTLKPFLSNTIRFDKRSTSGSTTSLGSNCYRHTRSNVSIPMDLSWLDVTGRPRRLIQVTNLTDLQNTPGSWMQTAGNQADFHLFDNRAPDANVVFSITGSLMLPRGNRAYIERHEFWGGISSPFGITNSNDDPSLYAIKDCLFALGVNGVTVNHNAQSVFILDTCEVFGASSDGFNYHNKAGGGDELDGPNVVEINCHAHHNGYTVVSNNTVPNNNGSTIHDAGKIIRIGGRYEYNQNRNIHDISPNTKVWILGSYVANTIDQADAANSINLDFGSHGIDNTGMEVWLDGVVIGGGALVDLRINQGVVVRTRNMDLSGLVIVNDGGTLTTY